MVTEKSKANLISIASRTPEQRREMGRKGAKVANEKKKILKTGRELFELMEHCQASDSSLKAFKEKYKELKDVKGTYEAMIAMVVMAQALDPDNEHARNTYLNFKEFFSKYEPKHSDEEDV